MTSRLAASLPLFIALLLLTPLVISPGAFAHFSVSKAVYARTIIEVLGVVWVLLMLKSPRFRPAHSWVILAFTGYVAASFLAAVWGVNTTHSIWSTFDRMTGVFDWAHWLLLAVVLMSVVRSRVGWWLLLNGMLGITLVLSLIASTQVWGLSFIPAIIAKCRVDATLGNPSYLAPLLVMSVLVAAGLFTRSLSSGTQPQDGDLQTTSLDQTLPQILPQILPGFLNNIQAWRIFWLAVITFGSLVLVYTGTRGAVVGLAAGALAVPVAIFIWGNRGALRPVTLASAGVMLTVGALFAVDHTLGLPAATNCGDYTATARITDLAETGINDSSLALRLSSARAGLLGFLDRPILGWGPENFGYAFDQHVEPQIFQQGSFVMDKAHNQVIEEFTTKGLVGGLAFLAMWAALVWAVVRRRRPVQEEILAYAILGALTAYFVQNLFLFDTPSALLWWVILAAWVAWQEKETPSRDREAQANNSIWRPGYLRPAALKIGAMAFPKKWVRNTAPLVLLGLLAISVYQFNWQPHLAAYRFGQSSQHAMPHDERLALAQQSFATFPQMANQPRRLMLLNMLRNWEYLDAEERGRGIEFFAAEGGIALREDSHNAPMLITAILFMQSTGPSVEVLASVQPMLQRLEKIAPNRPETHQLLANQALLEGRYAEALEITSRYQDRAPDTELFFAGIERAAGEALRRSGD